MCVVLHRRPHHRHIFSFPSFALSHRRRRSFPQGWPSFRIMASAWLKSPAGFCFPHASTLPSHTMQFAVCIAVFPLPERPADFGQSGRPHEPMPQVGCSHGNISGQVPLGCIFDPRPPVADSLPHPKRLKFFSRNPLLHYGPPARLVPWPHDTLVCQWRRWQ